MEQSKLCPRCGKSIPAGRTYCMSCGATVATKCPDCGKILPLNPKVCDGCGHSFVQKKTKAKKKQWRIPERILLTVAFLGGSLGSILGMQLFRHKTKHLKFSLGLPAIFALQAVLIIYLYSKA